MLLEGQDVTPVLGDLVRLGVLPNITTDVMDKTLERDLPPGVVEVLVAAFKETHQDDHQKFVLERKLPRVCVLLKSFRKLFNVFQHANFPLDKIFRVLGTMSDGNDDA